MATDIASILVNTQTAIDKAVETITATTETQRVLKENIITTDTKIGVHDHAETSHEDLRLILADQPAMITEPTITGPSAVETGEENSWVITAAGVIPTVSILNFTVVDNKGNKFIVPADVDGQGIFKHTFIGTRDEHIQLSIRARGTFDFVSKEIKFLLLITQHMPPSLATLTHNFPSRVSYGKTYPFSISGITDIDSDLTDVSVLFDDTKLSFAQSTNLTQGQTYSFSVLDTAKGPGTTNITIRATDARGLTNSLIVTTILNSDPVLTNLNHTIPLVLLKDSTTTCRVGGVTDPEGDTVTFSIASSNPSIVPSKHNNIALNENFTLTAEVGATIPQGTLTLIFTDGEGGSSTTTINTKIGLPPSVTNLVMTQPSKYIPGQQAQISFAGAIDSDGIPTTYSIVNTHSELSFSKSAGIIDNEQITVTVSALATRGTLYPVTVQAIDTYGSAAAVNMPIQINMLPDISNIITDIPEFVIPGNSYTWSISGISDNDGQAITYSVSSSNADVILTNAVNRSTSDTFQCTVPTEDKLARGQSFPLTLTVSDGLEQVTRVYTVKQNILPSITNLSVSIPDTMFGGIENAVPVIFTGAADSDNAFTYKISDIVGPITLSKQSGITESETVTLSATKVTESTLCSFNVYVKDTLNEVSEKHSVSITLNPIVVTAAPTITYPVNNDKYVPNTGFTLTLTEYTTTIWTGEGTYPNN